MSVVVTEPSDDNGSATADELAQAANSAGAAEAHSSTAERAAGDAAMHSDSAHSAAASAGENADHAGEAAVISSEAASVAVAAAEEARSISQQVEDGIMAAMARLSAVAQAPVEQSQPKVSGPEEDESPGNGHWFFRKWGKK